MIQEILIALLIGLLSGVISGVVAGWYLNSVESRQKKRIIKWCQHQGYSREEAALLCTLMVKTHGVKFPRSWLLKD